MESFAEIIDKLADIEVSVKCQACGAVITMIGKQYTARCHDCGLNITLTPGYLAGQKMTVYQAKYGKLETKPKCNVCFDKGIVILKEQEDDHLGEYVYRCHCQAGQKRPEAWPVVPAAKVVAFVPRLRLADAESHEEKEKAAGAGYF